MYLLFYKMDVIYFIKKISLGLKNLLQVEFARLHYKNLLFVKNRFFKYFLKKCLLTIGLIKRLSAEFYLNLLLNQLIYAINDQSSFMQDSSHNFLGNLLLDSTAQFGGKTDT